MLRQGDKIVASTLILRESIAPKDLETIDQFDKNQWDSQHAQSVVFSDKLAIVLGVGSVNISHVLSTLSDESLNGFKKTIGILATSGRLAGTTIINRLRAITTFLKAVPTSHITVEAVSSYLEYVRNHGNINNAADFRLLLLEWHKLGFEGIDNEVADFLNEFRISRNQRPMGNRIRSDNPTEGWYTDKEYDDLVSVIWADYEANRNSLWNTTACLLCAQYGRRPVQLSQLKTGDLKKIDENCGVSGKRIEFPGAKDQGTNCFREAKLEVHPMSDALWNLCQLQATESVAVFESLLGRTLAQTESKKLPLFHPRTKPSLKRRLTLANKHLGQSENLLISKFLHITPKEISVALIRNHSSKKRTHTPVLSERTGKPLVENAYRFRYTRARQLARMGVPRTTLQFWMGHENPKTIDAYYDDPAERARVLNDAIEPLMAPLAQAFQGIIRDSETNAMRGDDPSSRIELDGRVELGVGTCGEHGFCSASVPIPCYRCTKFQPWVYGPHEEVLERLLERQRLENGAPLAGRGKRLLVPLQLNKDIDAVRSVIMLCNNRKQVLKG